MMARHFETFEAYGKSVYTIYIGRPFKAGACGVLETKASPMYVVQKDFAYALNGLKCTAIILLTSSQVCAQSGSRHTASEYPSTVSHWWIHTSLCEED